MFDTDPLDSMAASLSANSAATESFGRDSAQSILGRGPEH